MSHLDSSKNAQETSHEERTHRRMQVVYGRRMRERQIYMEDLKDYRKRRDRRIMKAMKDAIGPAWYQALSVPQRMALDTLEFTIYQDIIERRPSRTQRIMKALGIIPRPNTGDLMNCVCLGRDDPKEMLAQLFLIYYGHTFDGKRSYYDLNGRLLLSAIFYLGLGNLIHLLRERFRPDKDEKPEKPKLKPKIGPPLASPYLQEMVAHMYEPTRLKTKQPAPLPNLDDLNQPYEEDPPLPKPPPPPPPPPPPKNRLPRAFCDKVAAVYPVELPCEETDNINKKITGSPPSRKVRDKSKVVQEKKKYGMGTMCRKPNVRRRKPQAPTTGMWNSQYTISGVYNVHGRTVFVLANVSILPPNGVLIHGGYTLVNGENVNIHCGFRGRAPPAATEPCDCVHRWGDPVLQYVNSTKCYCGHRYDYNNEGTFLPEELPFFQKPTRHSPFQFHYDTIYDLDPKQLHVKKEFKRLWDTESLLQVDDGTQMIKKVVKKKKRTSSTCLGDHPLPEDYLKCALRLMRHVNIAARLPDIHLAPELLEWMRRRLFGPWTRLQKAQMINKSNIYWQMFTRMHSHGVMHVPVAKEERFSGSGKTWFCKQTLNNQFQEYIKKYRLKMFRMHAEYINLLWPSMFQAQLPDKKFREIYFSYLFGTVEDLQVMHPYCSREVAERYTAILKRQYKCPPAGIELITDK